MPDTFCGRGHARDVGSASLRWGCPLEPGIWVTWPAADPLALGLGGRPRGLWRPSGRLWLVSVTDFAAMAHMFTMMSAQLAWLSVVATAWFAAQTVAWAFDLAGRALGRPRVAGSEALGGLLRRSRPLLCTWVPSGSGRLACQNPAGPDFTTPDVWEVTAVHARCIDQALYVAVMEDSGSTNIEAANPPSTGMSVPWTH